jgi:hypothetical protein
MNQLTYFQNLLNAYANLKKLSVGYYLQVDGDFGKKSVAAMQNFQKLESLSITQTMDKNTYIQLTKKLKLNVWNNPNVNCWIDAKGTRGENKYKIKNKKFIVLHHTVSGGSPFSIKKYFEDKKFGTQFVLGSQGDFVQCYNDMHSWGFHLNVNSVKKIITKAQEDFLAENSTAVEICNFGAVKYKDGKFYNSYGILIDESLLIDYRTIYGNNFKFRGATHFEKYTDAQIKSLKFWILDMIDLYDLDLSNDKRNLDLSWFNFDKNAYEGKYALFTHTNVREDKSDLHPQPEIIQMLKEIYKR